MVSYVFRVWLQPNPPLEFEPDEPVWRDITVGGDHTLADFHETIFDAFDRWDTHTYEFLTHDEDGIATRRYVHPDLYDDGPSWPPMDDAEVDRFVEQVAPDDASDEAIERFRELRTEPPPEVDASERRIEALDLDEGQTMFYQFDMGDGWEHHVELRTIRDESVDGEPVVLDEQGDAPQQYPGQDEWR